MMIIELLLLLSLLVFAILIVQQPSLRTAIIFLGVFTLLISVLYLIYNAPDVALTEAVIGSTLATVLYLVSLRKQEDYLALMTKSSVRSVYRHPKAVLVQRVLAFVLATALALVFLKLYSSQPAFPSTFMREYYTTAFRNDTSADNAVAAIYLRYRLYDTLFETLTLMVSVMAVIFFSRYQEATGGSSGQHRQSLPFGRTASGYRLIHEQQLAAPIISLLYPFILLFGTYIILFGHITPGGGFQGGAVVSAVVIMRYIMLPINDLRLTIMQAIEKLLFVILVLTAVLVGLTRWPGQPDWLNTAYLIVMNSLIGIKVCFGISILFLRFVFYESR